MYLKVQLPWNVVIPAESLDTKGLMLQKSIIIRLLDEFCNKKATKDYGHFLAVKTLDKVGEGKVRQQFGDVLFPVVFSCVTFKIFKGEILEGVVHKILKQGAFLKCGPVENIFLSNQKMRDYQYVPGENPIFLSKGMSRIEKDVKVRFLVIGTKWQEIERDFMALVSLEGNVAIPAESLDTKGLMVQKLIIMRLLDEFCNTKATKEYGHFLAVTTLDKIGEGKVRQQIVLFAVVFSCVTFKIFKGEILEGVVKKIIGRGSFEMWTS